MMYSETGNAVRFEIFIAGLGFTHFLIYMKHPTQNSRSCHQKCSVRKGVLKNFTKFTGKHLWQTLFLIKLVAY